MAESSRSFNNVTRQIAWEDILNNQRRESFKSHNMSFIRILIFLLYFLRTTRADLEDHRWSVDHSLRYAALDSVNRTKIWECLNKLKIAAELVNRIKQMFEIAINSVKTNRGVIECFKTKSSV